MRIVSLDLENTKSYTKGKIAFTDGVNAIVGHNGAGKSTVLEAIGFALFDSLAGYKQSDFVREGAKSAEIIVTIVSGLDDRAYQVVRRCGSTNHHAVYDPDLGTKICEGKADVLHFLRQHMGVDPTADLTRLFSDAVGVPQGTFTAAFLQTPAQRKAVFDPLLQVEEYKSAFDKLLEPLRTLQQQSQTLAIDVSGLQGRLERLPTIETAIAERVQTLTQHRQELATTQSELANVSAMRTALDTVQQLVAERHTAQQQAAQQRITANTQLQGAQAALQEAQTAAAIVAENQHSHDRYLAAQQELKRLDKAERERQQLERQLGTLDKELSLNHAEIDRYRKELEAIAAAEAQILVLAPAVEEQQRLEGAMQIAQQQYTKLDGVQRQLTDAEANYQRQQERLVTLEAKLVQAGALEQERVAQEQSGEQLRLRLDGAKETLLQFKIEADTRKEQSTALEKIETALCPLCEQPLTPAHRLELRARNEARLVTLREQYRTQQQQIKNDEADLIAIQAQLKKIQQNLRAMPREDERTALRQEIGAIADAIATLRVQVVALQEAPTQLRTLEQQLAQVGDPRQQMAVIRAMADRKPTLEAAHRKAAVEESEIRAKLQAVQTTLLDYAALDAELQTMNEEVQESMQGYQQVLRYQQVASTLPNKMAEVAKLSEHVAAAEQAIIATTAALAEAEAQFDNADYQRLRSEEQRLRDRDNSLQTELTFLQREQSRDEAERATLLQLQSELATLQQKQDNTRQRIEVLESLRGLLRQAGPYITKALIKQISDGAMQIFSDIMQDYTRHLRWNEDYGITLEVDGRERQFAQLSGGEQMTAALAVRLALLREMSNIDVAFFDEPTTNLDEERRDALARQILDVKGFRQLFIISHDDTFEQATQNLIRIARINGVSTVQQS